VPAQDIATIKAALGMSENTGHLREGQDDYWLNIGLAFPPNDSEGFKRHAASTSAG